ncbi:MAG: reverse transcriptase domain-containing protein, partial [Gaiellaceae bacterium]
AYLEAKTKEKLYIVAGSEFGQLEGHVLVFNKALYGLRTSGARWHEKMADTLRNLGWQPTYADPDVWMKDCTTHYEYVCVYVDDILVIGKDPSELISQLRQHFKLKDVGPPSAFLGGNFERRNLPEKVMTWGSKTYVNKILNSYKDQHGELPMKSVHTPLETGDHPELDTSAELDIKGIQLYQSLIGMLQWAVTLGRIDIFFAVMTMSRFRVAPRVGHLDRIRRIFAYLKTYNNTSIKFRVDIPNYDGYPLAEEYDWTYVYGDVNEELPENMPRPKGKMVRTSSYVDANLQHDLITGRSASGVLHFVNKTPIDWYCKRQNTVETATYGTEFVAARIAT